MKVWLRRIGFVLALAFLALTFVNASWIAPSPRGNVKLIAHRGAYQLFDKTGVGRDSCTATRIEAPWHPFLENTLAGIDQAKRTGAQMIEVDIAPTSDGRVALFHDWTVDCRTNGTGKTRDLTLAELKALDAGHGYSADGGQTFPFRGKGLGAIPSLEEALTVAGTRPLLYNFKGKDAAEADLLAAALKAAGRDVEAIGDAFYGHPAPVARIAAHFPRAWAFSREAAMACTRAYLWQGWLGMTPSACKGQTLFVPLNRQWAFAGWPNRLQARIEAVGGRVVMLGPDTDSGAPMGLWLPEQIGGVPASFTGHVWVDDIQSVGPALRPAFNRRTPPQEAALAKALAARRAKWD